MRRSTTLFLVLAAAPTLVLAACGGGDDVTDTARTATTEESNAGHDGGHDESSPVVDGAREIEVSASSFEFGPDEITVAPGEEVVIVLTSTDVLHDFAVDELDAHVAADVDETVEGGLRADDPGEYTYYCTVPGHREAGMEGTLIVEAL